MGAEPSENADFTHYLEGKAVSSSDSSFPYISMILHFFDIQGWVTLVAEKKFQFFINCLLKLVWKCTVISYETISKK